MQRASDTYVSSHKPLTVLPHNHFFEIKTLPQDKAPLYMKTETDIFSFLTIALDLSPQAIVTLLFAVHTFQNITRGMLVLHIKTQPINFEKPHVHPLHFP